MTIDNLITLSEAARRFGENVQTTRAFGAAGWIPAYRHGLRFTRVAWDEVLRALASGPRVGSSDPSMANTGASAGGDVDVR